MMLCSQLDGRLR